MKAADIGIWALRLALAGVYLGAAVPKILDPWAFARSIANFHLAPQAMIPMLALWVPALEALAAVTLVVGRLYGGGVLLVTVLSAGFAGAVASAVARGLDIECGCFGTGASMRASLGHLLLNLGLVVASVVLMTEHARRRGTRRSPSPEPDRRYPGA